MQNMESDITISLPPSEQLQKAYHIIFSENAKKFIYEMFIEFETEINNLYKKRIQRKRDISNGNYNFKFQNVGANIETNWKIDPVPLRLINRHLDLGDVSPANIEHLKNALNANVQGIQIDFDDGHCPNWTNQINGLYNVYQIVRNQLLGVPNISKAPVLMLRPRAWNMMENHIMIHKKPIPGPIVDFALLMFHNAKILFDCNSGPYFYLSKMEGANEAKLWNNIFIWTQRKLNLPPGSIKACVLIENILSSFEMDQILYELRHHSLGLNCGIWDYAASIISKFGDDPKYLLPDRNKYVDMEKHFLKKYLQKVVRVCHLRGAHATGGMYAKLLPNTNDKALINIEAQKAIKAKCTEIVEGIDGFMVYDINLVPYMNQLWKEKCGYSSNQIQKQLPPLVIHESDLLSLPDGGVTMSGLTHNIHISILYILNWLTGQGHFIYDSNVEDSATAEISRSQVWQWLKYNTPIENYESKRVTLELVTNITGNFMSELLLEYTKNHTNSKMDNTKVLVLKMYVGVAAALFLEIVTSNEFPEFITSFLNDHYLLKSDNFGLNELNLNAKL